MVTIYVNGGEREVAAGTTVAALVHDLALPRNSIAVEVNRAVVPRSEHAARVLEERDRIEIVTMLGGG